MTVKQLIEMLQKYPSDMQVVTSRYSDWQIINETEWEIIKGVNKPNIYSNHVMQSHKTMSQENKDKEKEYLALEGN